MYFDNQPARPARLAGDEKDFAQIVIHWTVTSLNQTPPTCAELSHRPQDYKSYLSRFCPLIIEDARASVAAGLAKAANRCDPVFLTSTVRAPKDPNNPWILNFNGTVTTTDDTFLNTSVILLKHKTGERTFEMFLGIANAPRDGSTTFTVKAYIRKGIRESSMLHKGERWLATYLGSIVTHNRMFSACKTLAERAAGSCLAKVVSSTIQAPPVLPVSSAMPGLNVSQTRAVRAFQRMSEGLLMLQGPPGTGKTTTITTMLGDLYLNRTRTLVCAPSNKAVQVLALRFLQMYPQASVIFVGVESKLQAELLPITYHSFFDRLQTLVRGCCQVVQKFSKAQAVKVEKNELLYSVQDNKIAMEAIVKIKADILEVAESVARYTIESISKQTIQTRDRVVYLCDHCLGRRFIASVDSGYGVYWVELTNCLDKLQVWISKKRESIEETIMKNSTIVFSTLSVSGRESMLQLALPSVLIVDEAGQSVEAETLIAFQHNPRKVLLVGDTKQLPATVISPAAKTVHYDWSMMHRLADLCEQSTMMLEEQYRMDPSISSWPSKQYYDSRLRDGASIATRAALDNFPEYMQSYAFYDLPPSKQNKEQAEGMSTKNEHEARYIALAVTKLRKTCPNATVGIITPYSAQVRCIEKALRAEGQPPNATLRVSSVDGFQGDECDFIFISFVRCNKNVGFVDDAQRLNVAITRAKYGLFMVGSATTLMRSAEFNSMFSDARKRGSFHTEAALMAALDIEPTPKAAAAKKSRSCKKAPAQAVEAVAAPPAPPAVSKKHRSGQKASPAADSAVATTFLPAPPAEQSARAAKDLHKRNAKVAGAKTQTPAARSKVARDIVDEVTHQMAASLHLSAPVLKMSGGPPCPHFAKGSCKYGTNCKFFHM